MPESDETVFRKVQAGSHEAFAVLVERYQRRAFRPVAQFPSLGNGILQRALAKDGCQTRPTPHQRAQVRAHEERRSEFTGSERHG